MHEDACFVRVGFEGVRSDKQKCTWEMKREREERYEGRNRQRERGRQRQRN